MPVPSDWHGRRPASLELDLPDVLVFKQAVLAKRGTVGACTKGPSCQPICGRGGCRRGRLRGGRDLGLARRGLLIYLSAEEADDLLTAVTCPRHRTLGWPASRATAAGWPPRPARFRPRTGSSRCGGAASPTRRLVEASRLAGSEPRRRRHRRVVGKTVGDHVGGSFLNATLQTT